MARSRLVIGLILFVMLLVGFSHASFPVASWGLSSSNRIIPIPGAAQYVEDFLTTTYLDTGTTTAEGWGTGQISVPRVFEPALTVTQLDFYPTPLPTRSIDVQDRKAYIGWYNTTWDWPICDSVQILNISDPNNLTPISNLDAGTKVTVVRVSGDTLFVGTAFNGSQYYNYYANWGAGVIMYNVSNPYAPTIIDVWGGLDEFHRYSH